MSTTIAASRLNATHQKALTYMGAVRPNVRMIAIEVLLAAQAAGHTIKVIWGMNSKSRPEHSSGAALDFMVYNDRAAGDWITNYLWTNRARLGVRWMIWRQRIRSTSPGKPGTWQWMADRGNSTQNHMDHPHVFFHVKTYTPPKGGVVPTNPTSPGGGSPSNAKGTPYKVTTRGAALNGRSGAGTNHPITMTAANGYVLSIVETKSGWARSTGGHWYSMQYLTKQGGASKPAAKPKAPAFPKGIGPNKRVPSAVPLQRQLKKAGFMPAGVKESPNYGPQTQQAVARFHNKHTQFRVRAHDVAIGPKGWAFLFTNY